MSTKTAEFKIKVDNNFKETSDDLDGLNKGLKDTSKETGKVKDASKSANADMGALGATRFTGVIKSIGTTVKAFFTLRGAILATGIGALVLLILSLKAAFTRSEEGQNKFAKILAVIGGVVDNLMDILSRFGEVIISAFEDPVESIKTLAKAIKDNIVNRIMGLLELLPALGRAIEAVFSLEFAKAGKIATDAVAKVTLGVENFTDKVGEAADATAAFLAEVEREAKITAGIADERARAEKIERKLIVERAKAQTKISELQLKSRQEEKFSEEQRMAFAKQALKRTDDLLAKEEEVLKIRFEAIKLENTLADSNKDALNAQANAEAELINLQTRRLDAEKTATKFLNTLRDELSAKNKARAKVEKQATIFGVAFTKEMGNEEITALTKIASDKYKLLVKAGKDRLTLQNAQDKLSIELMDEGFDKELAKLVANSEAQLLIAKGNKELELAIEEKFQKDLDALGNKDFKAKEKRAEIDLDLFLMENGLEKQKALLEKSYEAKFKLAEGDAVRTLALEKKLANDKEALDRKANATKVKMASDAFGALSSLMSSFNADNEEDAKKQFKITKALNLAQAVTNTALAVTGALTAGGNPVKLATGMQFVEAGIAGATGLANIVKIAGTQFEGASGGGIDVGSGSAPSVQAPNFNIVGDSGINQIASIQGQPMQAYVVSGEVSSQQALDRNRQQNATL